MNRRKTVTLFIVLVVISSAALWIIYPSLIHEVEEVEDETNGGRRINYSSLNDLNWWDIAWDLVEFDDFMTPFAMISNYPDRYGLTEDYYVAGDILIERLEGMGLTASYFGNYESVVAYQPGYGNDSRAIVFGANLDTRESIGPYINSNSIGCGVVTGIAAAVSQFRLPVDVYYCFYQASWVITGATFTNIIRALWGAEEILSYFQEESIDVIASYNFADLLFRDPLQDEQDRIHIDYRNLASHGYHSTKYIADVFLSFMDKSGIQIASAVEEEGTQSDHWKFWEFGHPAIHLHEGHQPDPEFPVVDAFGSPDYNYTQAHLVARAGAASAVYLAMKGNGHPTQQKVHHFVEPEDSVTLKTVMSVPQTLSMNGTVSDNQSITVKVSQSGTILMNSTLIAETNFSLQCSGLSGLGLISLTVRNHGNETVRLKLNLYYASDTDGNGLVDSAQYTWPAPDPPLDWDRDGLSDLDELENGTDMFHIDTDRDSMNDNVEILAGLNPLRRDAREDLDEDGLSNIREIRIGTHPALNDSDSDSIPDEWEVVFNTNPRVNDSTVDLDDDNLTNLQEYLYGSDPRSLDGDYDGVSDADEYLLGMNALSDDTDQDGLRDLLELQEGLDPLVPDFDLDLSADGLDHNPRINAIMILILLSLVPVSIGSVIFWRRVR